MRLVIPFFTFLLCNEVIAASTYWSGISVIDDGIYNDDTAQYFLSGNVRTKDGNRAHVRIGREKQCAIEDVVFLAPTTTKSEMIKIEHSIFPARNRYQRPPVAMDSGHPIFFLFGDGLAFLCPTRGFRYSDHLATGYLCVHYLGTIQFTMNFLSDTTGKNRMMLRKFDLSIYSRLDNFGGLE